MKVAGSLIGRKVSLSRNKCANNGLLALDDRPGAQWSYCRMPRKSNLYLNDVSDNEEKEKKAYLRAI